MVKAKVSRRAVKLEPVEEDQMHGESGEECVTDAMLKLALLECSHIKSPKEHEELGISTPDANEVEL